MPVIKTLEMRTTLPSRLTFRGVGPRVDHRDDGRDPLDRGTALRDRSNRDAVVSTINAFVIGAGVLAIAIVVVVNGENAAAAAVAAVGIGFTARGVRLLRLQRAPSFERDSATSSCSAPPANTAPAPTRSDI
jgi:hypothetical protein